ncbi:hypothetical protein EBT31_08280 [bacterium]|nr:hypothetical protein [bacterium]NBX50978.1 hypothetical protein [bacterium]
MPMTLSGDGTITGLAVGGLPDSSIATADIANAAITAAKLDGAQSGSAPIYAARAWVNFNGTGTVAIRASGNVSSITDNGVGDYTVNFTTAMSDANYSAVALPGGTSAVFSCRGQEDATARTTSAWRFITVNSGASSADAAWINVAISR